MIIETKATYPRKPHSPCEMIKARDSLKTQNHLKKIVQSTDSANAFSCTIERNIRICIDAPVDRTGSGASRTKEMP